MSPRSALYLALYLLMGLFAARSAMSTEVAAQSLQRFGLKPLKPTAAPPFTLPGVGGPGHSLSDYEGQWLLLTFFATWCGPCMQEMPSMQALDEELGTELPFEVVGISIDNTRGPVERFAKRGVVAFPLLHDDKGTAARDYRASSVPLSYLVNPAGEVVAMARGARDWQKVEPLLRQLALGEDGSTPEPGAIALAQLEPPVGRVELVTTELTVAEAFVLDVVVDWSGSADNYTLLPPRVLPPEGLRLLGSSVSSSSLDARTTVRYHLRLIADAPGAFELGPIALRYLPKGGQAPMSSQLAGPTLTVASAGTNIGSSGAVIGSALLAGVLLWGIGRARRRQRAINEEMS